MKVPPAIGFHCRVSRALLVLVLAIAALALAAVWISAAPRWLHLLLSLFIIACAGFALGDMLHPRVTSVLWHGEGGVDLTLGERAIRGRSETLGAVSSARVLGPLIVLTVRWPPRERAHLWILPDNLDAETRRRLRVRLAGGMAAGFASGNADSQ